MQGVTCSTIRASPRANPMYTLLWTATYSYCKKQMIASLTYEPRSLEPRRP